MKGKEFQEAQHAASCPPKLVNHTRRQPIGLNTSQYPYTSINYGIPLQQAPHQYPTFTSYHHPYHHYNNYDSTYHNPYNYQARTNLQSYTVTHPPSPPQLQSQHLAGPTTAAASKNRTNYPTQSNNVNNPTSTFGVILAITSGSNEDHSNKRQHKGHIRQVHHLATEGPHKNSQWSHIPITFDSSDLKLRDYPHTDAMVIETNVAG